MPFFQERIKGNNLFLTNKKEKISRKTWNLACIDISQAVRIYIFIIGAYDDDSITVVSYDIILKEDIEEMKCYTEGWI